MTKLRRKSDNFLDNHRIEVTLTLPVGTAWEFRLIDTTYDLPQLPGYNMQLPEDQLITSNSHLTLVSRLISLP